MPTVLTLLLSVLALLIALVVLFQLEKRRGRRFLDGPRAHLDFWILKFEHTLGVRFRLWGQYVLRQIFQYLFHTLLRGSISSLGLVEERLRHVLRSNKTLAQKSDAERKEKNKLEELALHKMEVALTEKEKRIRRQKSLEG